MKYGLTNPDNTQSIIDKKRRKLGIVVRKDKYLPGFGEKGRKYVCIDGEMFIENTKGDLNQYHEGPQ